MCVVENKIGDKERGDQLSRYRQRIEQQYPEYSKLFVYLTPYSEDPSDLKWVAFGYSGIADLLQKLLREHRKTIDCAHRLVIEQYCQILRRHVVKHADELVARARELYEKHQRAFDFIFENKSSYAESLHERLRTVITENEKLRLDSEDPHYFRFVPEEWDQITKLNTKLGWNDGSLITCELDTPPSGDRRLDLHVTVHVHGSDDSRRLSRAIYEALEGRKLQSKNEFLWVRKKRIPIPAELNDDFNEDVSSQLTSFVSEELPDITAKIRKAVAGFSKEKR